MDKNLSRIVADLFVKSKGGEELSSKIQRLRDEIIKVIEGEDAIFGKFRGLVESFREIIPEEKQRYNAAVKALSTTSKLSRQEIVKAVDNQHEGLKKIENGLMHAVPVWRDDLKVMDAKSKEVKDEISKLRDTIARLESEEEGIRKDKAAREKELDLIEKAMRELFSDIGMEITSIKKNIEELTSESAAVQPIPLKAPVKTDESAAAQLVPQTASVESDIPSEKKGGGEQKIEIQASAAPIDTDWQKKCPMCGGRMNFHANEKMWMCYSCAYEESDKGEVHGKSDEKKEYSNAPASEPIPDLSSSFAVPLADLSSNEYQGSKKRSSSSKNQPASKTKTCPSCSKKMYWYPEERAWRCPSCHYETRILG